MLLKHKLSPIFILFALLFWPVLTMAQAAPEQGAADFVGPPTAEEAAKAATEPGGTDFTGPLPAAEPGAKEPAKHKNSADEINVKLQVPLPFVPLNCSAKDANGSSTPAVCKLTDYLAGLYRLLIGVGALFAVVMFIIAGYQWIFSGGSSDKIGAAKKRIMGAVMGLILALLSYVILNTISARLVELRLPMVDPVPGIQFGGSGEFCQNSEAIKAYAATYGKSQTPPLTPEQAMAKLQFSPASPPPGGNTQPVALAETSCGQQYSIAGVDSVGTCKGGVCDAADTSCVNDQCLPVFLSGSIAWGIAAGLDPQNFFSNAYVNFINVDAICDNKPRRVQSLTTGKVRYFSMPRLKLENEIAYRHIAALCPPDKFKGFVLEVEINDDSNKFWPTLDDVFAVGKGCASPLGNVGASRLPPTFGEVDWAGINDPQLFFSVSDFDAGATCDLKIGRSMFPAL